MTPHRPTSHRTAPVAPLQRRRGSSPPSSSPLHLFVQDIAAPLGSDESHQNTQVSKAFLSFPIVRLYLFVLCSLPLFHAAHRIRYNPLRRPANQASQRGHRRLLRYGGAVLGYSGRRLLVVEYCLNDFGAVTGPVSEAPCKHQLKSISKAGIPEAIAKVETLPLPQRPEEAESICRDILAIEPEQQLARRMVGPLHHRPVLGIPTDRYEECRSIFQSLRDPYERFFTPASSSSAVPKPNSLPDALPTFLLPLVEEALHCFAEAEKIPPHRQRRQHPSLEPLRPPPRIPSEFHAPATQANQLRILRHPTNPKPATAA